MENTKTIILQYLKKELTMLDLWNMYYEIGKYIDEQKIDILDLEIYLKSLFGIVISFTRRNLKNMVKLYKKYDKSELTKLQQYKWIQIIEILNNKKINDYTKDESLLELKNLKNMI